MQAGEKVRYQRRVGARIYAAVVKEVHSWGYLLWVDGIGNVAARREQVR